MVYKCSIPNCKGNYTKNTKASVFSFPKDEHLRAKWLASIPRDFEVTAHSKVCEHHFQDSDIRRTSEAYDMDTGEKVIVRLQQPRLLKDAVPKIFPNCPAYFTNENISRENPADKRVRLESQHMQAAIADSVKVMEEYNLKNNFDSLAQLTLLLRERSVPSGWSCIEKEQAMFFIKVDTDASIPQILFSVKVSSDLMFTVCNKYTVIKNLKVFDLTSKLNSVFKLFEILEELNSQQGNTFEEGLKDLCKSLSNLANLGNEFEEKILLFLLDIMLLDTPVTFCLKSLTVNSAKVF